MKELTQKLRQRVAALKAETMALYLACGDSQTPWYAKLVAAAVVAYALSPIDLIPDFIPVLGLLDDLILVPLGLTLAIRLIPKPILEKCRAEADRKLAKGEAGGKAAAVVIVLVWVLALGLVGWAVYDAVVGSGS